VTKRDDGSVMDAGASPPLLEPVHVSDDPGRPDNVILGAPGAILVIISGPSGVGKDTIIDVLRRRDVESGRVGDRHYVVTMTTRAPREGEVDGVDYFFVTRQEFLRIRAERGFLEANEVHGNWYGSPRDQVRTALRDGKDVILKIDVQGAQIVKEQVSEAVLIFIIPPSLEALISRLRARATESADELEVRQRDAAIELARQGDFDHVVVNETGMAEHTADRIEAIIAEERAAHVGRRVRV
jgi:guanylate kinase